jgi:hypothetical protein
MARGGLDDGGVKTFRITFAVITLIGIGLIAGGAIWLVAWEGGAPARATITECSQPVATRYTEYECSGTWVAGGALVGGAGHVVIGIVEGAEPSDIGKTLDVRVSGDHAHTTSRRPPIILIAIGLLVAGYGTFALIRGPRSGRRAGAAPA